MWKEIELTGWGRSTRCKAPVARPERVRDVEGALACRPSDRLVARGAGRSYGDCALPAEGGAVILSTRLDRLLAFDALTGELTCEPGVTFQDLLTHFLPRGWLAPCSPGTAFVTIGGAVANDVHGKNHTAAGSFGDHVQRLTLAAPDGRIRTCSAEENPDLFRATIGGVGLTGFILDVTFRMQPVTSNAMQVTRRRILNLEQFLAAFAGEATRVPYSVGWLDVLANGSGFGRGILELAVHAETGIERRPSRPHRLPFDLPQSVLSRPSIRAFNAFYWRRASREGRTEAMPIQQFFYPLDSLLDWNRMYGKRGFRQFQCVLPFDRGERGLVALLQTAQRFQSASFLAVLKCLGPAGRGLMSFPHPGWTLALDVPERPGIIELFKTFERITLDSGGRLYLAKDSAGSSAGFRQGYPGLERFKDIVAGLAGQWHPNSALAERLGLTA